ncbi:MAG: glycine oxidase ThiO [Micrococcaceae bacterium]|uniref:glycine oxidase n=1 Tax=Arthrobacter cheniae TaxID=1258888 RepID=A0A3A5MBA6_9MICC|nr:glycine oxidase ThiO [Arthrobacter cheniae]MCU1633881.1 glycine oxidase ThiO [Micrococcaceae bacterium]RJT82899.1 glycine oxidase ThiO [Arthrobacter cheniae]
MTLKNPDRTCHTVVVGAGIIGLAIGWEASRRGHRVTLVDPAPAFGATHAAAGMLAPVSELHYQEESLLDLMLPSARIYQEFTEELEAASGVGTGYQRTQTLIVAIDAADRQALTDLSSVQLGLGLEVEELTTGRARRLEPLLGPQLTGACLVPGDHQVDPRALAAALQAALAKNSSVRSVPVPVSAIIHGDAADSTAVTGVLLEDGERINADEVILANGIGTKDIAGLPEGLRLPLRPVYGDILRMRVPEHLRPLVTSTVRGLVRGSPVYVVPRQDGTVVIGATQRENGSAGLSAGGVYELLRDAQVLIPAVAELELLEALCRPRPGTPDNAPLLGRCTNPDGSDVRGLVIATGFFRHGVLLAPITAHLCADLITRKTPQIDIKRFRPGRFSSSMHMPENSRHRASRHNSSPDTVRTTT